MFKLWIEKDPILVCLIIVNVIGALFYAVVLRYGLPDIIDSLFPIIGKAFPGLEVNVSYALDVKAARCLQIYYISVAPIAALITYKNFNAFNLNKISSLSRIIFSLLVVYICSVIVFSGFDSDRLLRFAKQGHVQYFFSQAFLFSAIWALPVFLKALFITSDRSR